DDFNKLNGRPLKALIDRKFDGPLYPVNPKYDSLAGLRCYPDIAALPDGVDLAIITTPGRLVPEAIRALGRKGVAAAVVFSSGFSEIGAAGEALERELDAAITASGVRVLGPNCLGFINTWDKVSATFAVL